MNEENLRWDEAKEVADHILGIDNPDEEYIITAKALNDKWEISMDTFCEIANAIYKTIDFSVSPLTHKAYIGIANNEGWIAKKGIESQFIGAVIDWLTHGEEIPENKGCSKIITVDEKPIYIIKIETVNN